MLKIPNRRSILWHIYYPFILVIFLVVGVLCFLAVSIQKNFYQEQLSSNLSYLGELVGRQVTESSTWKATRRVDVAALKKQPNLFINIYSKTGEELYSSHTELVTKSKKVKPSIKLALTGQTTFATRYISAMEDDFLFVTLPIRQDNQVALVIRLGQPLKEQNAAITKVWQRFLLLSLLITLIASLILWRFAKRVLADITDIQHAADRIAEGNLVDRLELPQQAELAKLAHAMNKMAHQLDDRIRQVSNKHKQLVSVLAGMNESVVAFDLDQRIIFMNSAAEKLLSVTEAEAITHFIPEIIRTIVVHEMVDELLLSQKAQASEFTYGDDNNLVIEARASILRDGNDRLVGGLLVLNDVTELRHLERVRKDFVANVSHELRTPVTAIKGFAETLLNSQVGSEDQKKFLEIIANHSNRVAMIIEDLLMLSSIEQQQVTASVKIELSSLSPIVEAAINSCENAAKSKNISIESSCPINLQAKVSPSLLEQALVNYIDNAIKYSEPHSLVRVEVIKTDMEVVIAVHDNGPGISEEYHSRLFERFYRVDKARSRKVGGTGLGLSIVKHIAQSMGGYPAVRSSLGRGSTFELHLPVTA